MSLQVRLKEERDALGRAILSMREFGLAFAEASERHEDGKAREIDEKFGKAQKDVEMHRANIERLERALEAERAYNTLSNGIQTGAPAEAFRGAQAGGSEKNSAVASAHREAFSAYLVGGERSTRYVQAVEKLSGVGPSEVHALLGTRGDYGGFLVPEDFRQEIVSNMAGYAVMRKAGVKVVQTSSSVLVYPSLAAGTDPYSTGVSGAWRAEGSQGTDGTAPDTQNQPTFGQERVQVHVWQPSAIVVTRELMQDSVVNLDSVIAEKIAEARSLDEDYAFITGTGVGVPRGIMSYVGASSGPSISSVISGDNSTFTYNGLLDLIHTLPAQYRGKAAFLCRSTAFSAILKLKDSTNQPIIYNQIPDKLFGKTVHVSEFMPAVAQNNYPLLFGDFSYYCVAERADMRIQRLEERFAPNIAFLPTARVGGAALRTQPFIAQKISST